MRTIQRARSTKRNRRRAFACAARVGYPAVLVIRNSRAPSADLRCIDGRCPRRPPERRHGATRGEVRSSLAAFSLSVQDAPQHNKTRRTPNGTIGQHAGTVAATLLQGIGDETMEQGRIAASARGRWYDGLTPMHWRVLRASFLGWIFDGYEALVLVVVLVAAAVAADVTVPAGALVVCAPLALPPEVLI